MVLSCIDTVEVILSDWWIYKGNRCFIMKLYIQDKYIDIVLIHSCNPAVLVAASEGGGGSRRRRKPARNRIVSLSYLFPIQTVTKLLTTSQGLKAPWGRPPKGKGLTLLRQDTCSCPGPSTIHHNRNLSGFPRKSTITELSLVLRFVFLWYGNSWIKWIWKQSKEVIHR